MHRGGNYSCFQKEIAPCTCVARRDFHFTDNVSAANLSELEISVWPTNVLRKQSVLYQSRENCGVLGESMAPLLAEKITALYTLA